VQEEVGVISLGLSAQDVRLGIANIKDRRIIRVLITAQVLRVLTIFMV
jgi:hypothetical protein